MCKIGRTPSQTPSSTKSHMQVGRSMKVSIANTLRYVCSASCLRSSEVERDLSLNIPLRFSLASMRIVDVRLQPWETRRRRYFNRASSSSTDFAVTSSCSVESGRKSRLQRGECFTATLKRSPRCLGRCCGRFWLLRLSFVNFSSRSDPIL